jgi:hypothetical protein
MFLFDFAGNLSQKMLLKVLDDSSEGSSSASSVWVRFRPFGDIVS